VRKVGYKKLIFVFVQILIIIAFTLPAHADTFNAEGFLTTTSELDDIRLRALNNEPPHSDNVRDVLVEAEKAWPYPNHGVSYTTTTVNGAKLCHRENDSVNRERVLHSAAQLIYGKVLAFYFTREGIYAKEARDLIKELTQSDGFKYVNGVVTYNGANQCSLALSWLVPLLIESAILLEGYPGWTDWHKNELQYWLAVEVYPLTAAISRTRKNNWGNAASFASWSIGHYLNNIQDTDPDFRLEEFYPQRLSLLPRSAKYQHGEMQLKRIGNEWAGDSQCADFGVQSHGGIPDELRRGPDGECTDLFLRSNNNAQYSYQQKTISNLVYHAEALKRHGHPRHKLYELELNSDVETLLQAIHFVVQNPHSSDHSYDWEFWQIGTLRVANRTFNNSVLCDQIRKSRTRENIIGNSYLPYTKITHWEVCRD